MLGVLSPLGTGYAGLLTCSNSPRVEGKHRGPDTPGKKRAVRRPRVGRGPEREGRGVRGRRHDSHILRVQADESRWDQRPPLSWSETAVAGHAGCQRGRRAGNTGASPPAAALPAGPSLTTPPSPPQHYKSRRASGAGGPRGGIAA